MSRRKTFSRAGVAVGISTLMVVIVAGLLPRAFLVNDDPGLILYLRSHIFTPWISPILVRVLSTGYDHYPQVPWFGLFQYALVVISSSVVIHTCTELLDRRPGPGGVATLLGACVLGAAQILVADGISWTVVAIVAAGTGAAALVAHLHVCQTAGQKASVPRALGYGLLVTCGYMLRPNALGAMVAALAPLFAWSALVAWRGRYVPRPAALFAAIAPLLLVLATQHRIPQLPGADLDAFNYARGQIHDSASYGDLHKRAPELLERAGWTVEEYKDFSNWSFLDDEQFSLAKIQRLVDTGAVPKAITVGSVIKGIRAIFNEATAAVWLFLATVLGTVLLAWLRVVAPGRGLLFGLGYLAFEITVSQWMMSRIKFPLRVALPFFVITAFGMFIIMAREIAARPAESVARVRGHRETFAVLATVMILFSWARSAIRYVDRPIITNTPEVRQFFTRVNNRQGFVLPSAGLIMDYDPLLPDPLGYSGLPTGWGSFTKLWYDYLARFGLHHGSEILPWMLDNPNAYVLTLRGSEGDLEGWVRRVVRDPRVRFELVDAAPRADYSRPELGRLVTGPLIRGSDEWRTRARIEAASAATSPGPPAVDTLSFKAVVFDPPYERHLLQFRDARDGTVERLDGGIRFTMGTSGDRCASIGANSALGGIEIAVHGLSAARFDLTLIAPENIARLHVVAADGRHGSIRWRWDLDADAQEFGFAGIVSLVLGYPAHQLALIRNTASAEDIRSLRAWLEVKPGTHAGFELRHVEVSEP